MRSNLLSSNLFRVSLLLSVFLGGFRDPAPLRCQTADSLATIEGRVLEHETDRYLQGAAVSLGSGPGGVRGLGTRVTGPDGGFRFQNVPPGIYRLSVTLLGYEDLRDDLEVRPGKHLVLVLPLSTFPVPMEPIIVRARPGPADLPAGFESRRARLGGTFWTGEEIRERKPQLFSDLLRRVPGARVIPSLRYGYEVRFRGGCAPVIWIDGTRVRPPLDLDALVRPEDLEAVEVYRGAHLPIRFGPSPCGGILIWTRRGRPQAGDNSLVPRLLLGTALMTLVWILSR